jgi:hydrogenase maturation protease
MDLRRKPLAVIGLGNEFLSDDGVGIRIVRELRKRLAGREVVCEELSIGGLPMLDVLTSYERCIIIDAVVTGAHPTGTAYRFVQSPGQPGGTVKSSHQIDLAQVLSLAALMGAELPRTVTVYGVEAGDTTTFRDSCSEEVSSAIPLVVEAVCRDLDMDCGALQTHAGEWHVLTETAAA